MVLLDELRVTMSDYRKDLKELYEVLGIEKAQARYDELQKQVADPDFYSDLENSQKVLQEVKSLENRINKYKKMEETLDDILTLIELTMEEGEEESNAELNEEADSFVKELESLKLASLLTGEYDSSNAILTFHAGAGGTEAQDWAEMLYRMYNRWAERHNFKAELLDYLDGDEAGLKSASIMISGDNAYGFLKSESGVHRLVRVSPFDSSGRRHTSFAALEVMPEIDDSMEVDIRPEDIKMDVFRASGAGGQHINKTSSAVRLTHLPTGIVVSCQTQRSQYQNKDYAMKMLRAKLVEIKEREHLDKIADIKGVQKEIAWGAQIRSYVFMPYTLVKDHRTGFENGNIQAVMDGDLDGFINAYLKANNKYAKSDGQINIQDVEDCVIFVVSSFSTNTSYENQTKKAITNKFIQEAMTDFFRKSLEVYFIENKMEAEKIANQVLVNMRARVKAENTRKTLKTTLQSKMDMTNRIQKFVDCRSKDVSEREVFIVEGDSALGACKQARDARFQAVIPVRGKILNCLKSEYDKIFKNDIITDLIKVLGCGVEIQNKHVKDLAAFDLGNLRWNKVVICTDGDVDGFQIRTLILTMLYRLTPTLIQQGYVYIAETPLFEINCGDKTWFAYSDKEKADIVKSLEGKKYKIDRSKGLGENDPDMMWLTTMNPETRRLIRVMPEDAARTSEVFDLLLGDNLQGRKDHIAENGARFLDLADIS